MVENGMGSDRENSREPAGHCQFRWAFYSHARFSNNRLMMFRAAGSLAEVREGFRRMIAETEPLDQMEIMLSDYERYASVLYSQAEASGSRVRSPMGFRSPYCTAGKAASAILAWIKEGFPVTRLRRCFARMPANRWPPSIRRDWIYLLEQSGIGWADIAMQESWFPTKHGDGQEELGMKSMRCFKAELDKLPGRKRVEARSVARMVGDFVEKHVPLHSSDDQNVKRPFKLGAHVYRESELVHDARVGGTICNWNLERHTDPGRCNTEAGGSSRYSIHNGGFSGRYRTWIVGMDERPGACRSCRILLLDEERTVVSTHLHWSVNKPNQSDPSVMPGYHSYARELWLSYASSYDPGSGKAEALHSRCLK